MEEKNQKRRGGKRAFWFVGLALAALGASCFAVQVGGATSSLPSMAARAMKKEDPSILLLKKESPSRFGYRLSLGEEDLSSLSEKSGLDLVPVQRAILFSEIPAISALEGDEARSFYFVSEENRSSLSSFSLLAGTYPQKENDVAIPQSLYEEFAEKGFAPEGKEGASEKISSPSDLLGKSLWDYAGVDLHISGVYSSPNKDPYKTLLFVGSEAARAAKRSVDLFFVSLWAFPTTQQDFTLSNGLEMPMSSAGFYVRSPEEVDSLIPFGDSSIWREDAVSCSLDNYLQAKKDLGSLPDSLEVTIPQQYLFGAESDEKKTVNPLSFFTYSNLTAIAREYVSHSRLDEAFQSHQSSLKGTVDAYYAKQGKSVPSMVEEEDRLPIFSLFLKEKCVDIPYCLPYESKLGREISLLAQSLLKDLVGQCEASVFDLRELLFQKSHKVYLAGIDWQVGEYGSSLSPSLAKRCSDDTGLYYAYGASRMPKAAMARKKIAKLHYEAEQGDGPRGLIIEKLPSSISDAQEYGLLVRGSLSFSCIFGAILFLLGFLFLSLSSPLQALGAHFLAKPICSIFFEAGLSFLLSIGLYYAYAFSLSAFHGAALLLYPLNYAALLFLLGLSFLAALALYFLRKAPKEAGEEKD